MLAEKYDLRKIAILFLAGVAFLWFLIWLYGYLATGKITVKTNDDKNFISIEDVHSTANTFNKPVTQSNELTKRVKPGKYMVYVSNQAGHNTTSKVVSVKARQKVELTPNPSEVSSAEPVYGGSASSISADSANLFFIDGADSSLALANVSGLSYPFHNIYKKIEWLTPGEGVGQGIDGSLFYIKNGQEQAIALPFGGVEGFSLAKNGDLYISKNKNVFVGGVGGEFKKIYTTSGGSLKLSAALDKLTIVSIVGGEDEKTTLETISKQGKLLNKQEQGVRSAQWSPDGKNLAVISQGKVILYDSNFKQKLTITTPSSVLVWRNNHSLAYDQGNSILLLDTQTGLSNQLVSGPTGSSTSNITFSEDGNYLYFNSVTDDGGQLNRANLDNKDRQSSDALSAFLPEKVGICELNYINFVKPILLISYPEDSTLPENCIKSAKDELRYYDINPGDFNFQVSATAN